MAIADNIDQNDPMCCFDSSGYTGTPDISPIKDPIDVPKALEKYDILNHTGSNAEAEEYLNSLIDEAVSKGDWRAELSFFSEMLGLCRKTGNEDAAFHAASRCIELIDLHHLGRTVSGATILLNTAATMHTFGKAQEALTLFMHALEVYTDNLDPSDYRFAGLYNNMAVSYAEVNNYDSAERFYKLALKLLSANTGNECDMAVTYCNMANLYDMISHEDSRIDDCIEKAWGYLSSSEMPHDGYLAYTISKCISCFDTFGYFIYARKLREIAAEIKEKSNAGA